MKLTTYLYYYSTIGDDLGWALEVLGWVSRWSSGAWLTGQCGRAIDSQSITSFGRPEERQISIVDLTCIAGKRCPTEATFRRIVGLDLPN
jgi:hypothetical protein